MNLEQKRIMNDMIEVKNEYYKYFKNEISFLELNRSLSNYTEDEYVFIDNLSFILDKYEYRIFRINELIEFCDEQNYKYYNLNDVLDDIFDCFPNYEEIKEKYNDVVCIYELIKYTEKSIFNSYETYKDKKGM